MSIKDLAKLIPFNRSFNKDYLKAIKEDPQARIIFILVLLAFSVLILDSVFKISVEATIGLVAICVLIAIVIIYNSKSKDKQKELTNQLNSQSEKISNCERRLSYLEERIRKVNKETNILNKRFAPIVRETKVELPQKKDH